MYINSYPEDHDNRLKIKGLEPDTVSQFEYLGIQIDNKLQINKHIDGMYKKARSKIAFCIKSESLFQLTQRYYCTR